MHVYFDGIIIGAAAFAIIGIFHPVVIKGEYYFGTAIWPLFAVSGAGALIAAVYTDHVITRSMLGISGFTMWWSIIELFQQAERVRKGWFPENPRREK